MITETPKVNPIVRVVANAMMACVLAGSTAYVAWLCGVPQWASLVFGALVLVGYGLMWLGSMEDNRNA
jgi:hypothetical protein